jgi:hypothetical protein
MAWVKELIFTRREASLLLCQREEQRMCVGTDRLIGIGGRK